MLGCSELDVDADFICCDGGGAAAGGGAPSAWMGGASGVAIDTSPS